MVEIRGSGAGDSEMAKRIRGHGWEQTPLGPIALWPQPLKTAVDIMVSAAMPLAIWWGPHYVLLYNDAYALILGDKHPRALGLTGRELWPEVWDMLAPQFAEVMAGRGARSFCDQLYFLERHGAREEAWFDYSLNPIHASDGAVAGIFNIVVETTGRKLKAKLQDAAVYTRSLIDAILDPLVAISAVGKIMDVNQATEQITGRPRAQLIGSYFSDYFTEPEKARQGFAEILAEGFVKDYPLSIRNVSGEITDVLYNATVLRNEAGAVQGVFATVRDITERKRAEESLRCQADQYATLIATTSDGYWRQTSEGGLLDVNDAYCRMSGYSREELLNRHISQLEAVETPQEVAEHIQLILTTGFDRFESRHRKKNGELWDVEISVSFWRQAGQLLVFVRDITERKRNEALNALRLHLVQFAQSHSLDELLEEALNGAERLTGSLIGFYHFVEEDQNALTLQSWSTRTKAVFCKAAGKGLHYPIAEAGVWADAVRQGRPVVHNDYASLPDRKGMPEGHAAVIRELVVPVRRGQKIVAAMGVGNKPTEYRGSDVETALLIADLAEEIAARKRAEEAVRKASLYARNLIEASLDPLVTISAEGKIMDVNQATERVTGRSRTQLIGSDFSDYFTEPEEARQGYRQVLADGFVKDYTLSIRNVSGEITDVLYNATVFRNEAGEVQGVFADARDITERKRAADALEHSERLLRTILEYLPVGVSLFDCEGQVIQTNPAVARLWGEARAGGPVRYHQYRGWFAQSGDPIGPHQWASSRAVERGETTLNEVIDIQGFDGVCRTVLNSAVPLRDMEGKVTGAVAVILDITELRQAERALRETNARLEQAMADLRTTQEQAIQAEKLAAVGTLAAGIAHELNNPLMGVMGYVALSKDREQDPELKEMLENAVGELERMRDLIKNLLGFARPVVEGKLSAVSAAVALERALGLLAPDYNTRGIDVSSEVPPDLPLVLAKTNELQQVFINLLTNARDAVEGSAVKKVHISARRAEDRVIIAVTDTGAGIPPEIQGRIFDPFFTTKPPGKGTGLGLSIARNIMTDLGGTLAVESRRGEGATFTVTLLLAP